MAGKQDEGVGLADKQCVARYRLHLLEGYIPLSVSSDAATSRKRWPVNLGCCPSCLQHRNSTRAGQPPEATAGLPQKLEDAAAAEAQVEVESADDFVRATTLPLRHRRATSRGGGDRAQDASQV